MTFEEAEKTAIKFLARHHDSDEETMQALLKAQYSAAQYHAYIKEWQRGERP